MIKDNGKDKILKINYEEQLSKLTEFLCQFEDKSIDEIDRVHGQNKYLIELQKIANNELQVLEILMEDLEDYFNKSNEEQLLDNIRTNTSRYN